MAAVAFVAEEALDDVADQRFYLRDDGFERMAIIGIAGQRLRVGDELTTLGRAIASWRPRP